MLASNVNLFNPYSQELIEIERRRKLAEALQAQSMQPIEQQPTPAGGFAIPISPMQGLAKIAQALAAAYGQSGAREQSKALGERYTKERADVVSQALKAGEAIPAQPENTDIMQSNQGLDTFDLNPAKAAVPADRARVYEALAANQNFPDLQNIGMAKLLEKPPRNVVGPGAGLYEGSNLIAQQPERMQSVTAAGTTGAPETRFVRPDVNMPPIPQPVRSEVGPAGQVYNPYQQQPGSVLADPNKPFQATPGGGQTPNQQYQNYEMGLRTAGRPQVQTQVNVPPASKVFENENKLRDDYTVASKPFVGIRDAYNTIKASLAGPITAVSTLAGATKFMKMIDPESVVRESELQMALKAAGLWDRFTNLHNWVMKGQVLTPTQAEQIKEIAGVLYDTASQQQQKLDQYYGGLATQYGLEPQRVIRNQSAVMAPGSDQPVERSFSKSGRPMHKENGQWVYD